MIIVIPHYNHNQTQHLKYALRSIAIHEPDAVVTIVGDRPDWVKGVGHIRGEDDARQRHKERNIYRKIKQACNVFDKFVVVHDDNYLLAPIDTKPYRREAIYKGNYQITMDNTFRLFGPEDHDMHRPVFIEADKFNRLATLDWDIPFGYGVVTCYRMLNKIPATLAEDLKIDWPASRGEIKRLIEGRDVFSSGDIAFQGEMRSVLMGLFPNKCKFEI